MRGFVFTAGQQNLYAPIALSARNDSRKFPLAIETLFQ